MARLYNTFEFVGNISIPKDADKFLKVNEYDSGWVGHRLNFAVQESKTNSTFVDLQGGYSKAKSYPIKTFGKGTENVKGSNLEIPWEERKKPETLDLVADFKKIVVDYTTDQELKKEIDYILYQIRTIEYKDKKTEEDNSKLTELKKELAEKAVDRTEFLHNYDAILHISKTLENYKDHKFRIKGSVSYSESKGKFYRSFNPELIEIVSNETDSKLRSTMDIFFTKDAVDDKDFDKEKKVYIDGFLLSYDHNAKKDQFFPQQYVINAQKIDFKNEQQVGLFNFLKNKFNIKGKGVHHLQWEVNIFRGADKVEFTDKDLTAAQKEAIEFGFNTLEDFAPKGGVLGETLYENRLVKPILKKVDNYNDFSDGAVESTYEIEDLDFTYSQVKEKKQDDIGTVEELEVKTEKVDISKVMDDLFA